MDRRKGYQNQRDGAFVASIAFARMTHCHFNAEARTSAASFAAAPCNTGIHG
jgi:hypothetical protein